MKVGDIMQEKANGSVQANLSKNNLINCEIPFPKDINKLKPQLNVQKSSKLFSLIIGVKENIGQLNTK
jgi:hypothetical protein